MQLGLFSYIHIRYSQQMQVIDITNTEMNKTVIIHQVNWHVGAAPAKLQYDTGPHVVYVFTSLISSSPPKSDPLIKSSSIVM